MLLSSPNRPRFELTEHKISIVAAEDRRSSGCVRQYPTDHERQSCVDDRLLSPNGVQASGLSRQRANIPIGNFDKSGQYGTLANSGVMLKHL